MQYAFVSLVLASILAWSGGCVETAGCGPGQKLVDGECRRPPPPCEDAVSRQIQVFCPLTPDFDFQESAGLFWELTVQPELIESGEPFSAVFRGKMIFDSGLQNIALRLFSDLGLGGFRRVAIVSAQAKVQVRDGAELVGNQPVLMADIPETCSYTANGETGPDVMGEFPDCAPERNIGDPNALGFFANEECVGLGGAPDPDNPCLSYVEMDTTTDCKDCERLGFPDLCESPGFCAIEQLEAPLGPQVGDYLADGSGQVLFGWTDELPRVEAGPRRGTYMLGGLRRDFGDRFELGGVHMWVAGVVGVTWGDCVMASFSGTSDGIDVRGGASPSPDSLLISCPIEESP